MEYYNKQLHMLHGPKNQIQVIEKNTKDTKI